MDAFLKKPRLSTDGGVNSRTQEVPRTKVLRDALSAAGKDNSTLHSASETRWVERHDAVSVFQESFKCIVGALEKVVEWGDEHGSKASSFHACLCKFDFIITLTIMNKMMSLTYIVSKYLQKESIDLSSAMLKIELVQQKFSEMRKEGDKEFLQLYRRAEDMGEKLGIKPKTPRVVGTQRFRSNVEANNPEEYYRIFIFYPYIDEISSSLTERFTSHKDVLIGLDSVLPCNIQQRQFTDLEPTLDFYQSDLVHTNRDILNAEWELWKSHWKIAQVTPKTATSVLKALKDEDDAFPNMKILLGILAVLPVTTASVER
ncbi:uncharacterized protein LOC126886068 [Diabrotica virgifera virgifera]|uniref:52 kDa repressor of the inhibitor of the protein kinase-like n=1 Tax=Diabrotica virgifera virgifera TaxID=50390 RepID=A0ABM5KF87_DIAVI|nr:uncharacterized protein LOC126886068 [Diabrotica virgifera virgifera]